MLNSNIIIIIIIKYSLLECASENGPQDGKWPFTINASQLAAFRETNWRRWSGYNPWGSFRLSWKRTRHGNTRWGTKEVLREKRAALGQLHRMGGTKVACQHQSLWPQRVSRVDDGIWSSGSEKVLKPISKITRPDKFENSRCSSQQEPDNYDSKLMKYCGHRWWTQKASDNYIGRLML